MYVRGPAKKGEREWYCEEQADGATDTIPIRVWFVLAASRLVVILARRLDTGTVRLWVEHGRVTITQREPFDA
jgi:hypothetical protein